MGAACSSGPAGCGKTVGKPGPEAAQESSVPCELEDGPERDERKLAGGDPTRSSSEVADCQDKQEALQESQRSESKKIGRDLWRRNSHAAKNSQASKAPTRAKLEIERQCLASW